MQPDRRLSGARGALHADRGVEVGPDEFVLLRLDRGDDVTHRPDARSFDLARQDLGGRAEFLAPLEMLVFEAGELRGARGGRTPAEPAADRHALRVAHARAVERPGDRRPPVEDHRLAEVVDDVTAADVIGVAGVLVERGAEVEPAEEQRRGRVVGEFGDPAGELPPEAFGRERVARDLVAAGEQSLGPASHAGERRAGRGQMGAFGV